ncbi:MAG: hypothetical protein ACR2PA_06735 [Hyphomicrobiaceae bacterium]
MARVYSYWQLLVLSVTSLVLSVASGWTTWLGMQNFTGEEILSLMVTFGIQGVLLVLAWLIGVRLVEDFAKSEETDAALRSQGVTATSFVELLLIFSGLLLALNAIVFSFGVIPFLSEPSSRQDTLENGLAALFASILVGLIALRYGRVLVRYLLRATAIAANNIIPLSMLLACLLTSIFFSFDALFSKILPEDERRRIADLRAQTAVIGVLNEISDLSTKAQAQRRKGLFLSPEWKSYAAELDAIRAKLDAVPGKIDQILSSQADARRAEISRGRAQIHKAEAEIVGVNRSAGVLRARVKDARARLSAAQVTATDLRNQIGEMERKLAIKRFELEAEEEGLGVTRKAGRGPTFRQLQNELIDLESGRKRLQVELDLAVAQEGKANANVDAAIQQQSLLERSRSDLTLRLEGLKRARGQEGGESSYERFKNTASKQVRSLAQARTQVEQAPSQTSVSTLEAQCRAAADFLGSLPPTLAGGAPGQCSASALRTASARLFSLNAGRRQLADKCLQGDTASASADRANFDTQVQLARNCLVWSALLPSQTAAITTSIDALERERDDKAHRFVVTTNAFLDSNKLAMLAAGIASAIDLLVIASGLLGALVLRPKVMGIRAPVVSSPASTQSSAASRPDLAKVLALALAPDSPGHAARVLAYVRSVSSDDGFSLGVDTSAVDESDIDVVRQCLNVGAAFNCIYRRESLESDDEVLLTTPMYFALLDLAGKNAAEPTSTPQARAQAELSGQSDPSGLQDVDLDELTKHYGSAVETRRPSAGRAFAAAEAVVDPKPKPPAPLLPPVETKGDYESPEVADEPGKKKSDEKETIAIVNGNFKFK